MIEKVLWFTSFLGKAARWKEKRWWCWCIFLGSDVKGVAIILMFSLMKARNGWEKWYLLARRYIEVEVLWFLICNIHVKNCLSNVYPHHWIRTGVRKKKIFFPRLSSIDEIFWYLAEVPIQLQIVLSFLTGTMLEY